MRGSSAKYTEYRQAARAAANADGGDSSAGSSPVPSGLAADVNAEAPDDQQREGEREWGQPAWVSDAYARAAARVEAKLAAQQTSQSAASAQAPAAPTDEAPSGKEDEAAPRGEVEVDSATWARNAYARAKARAGVNLNGLPDVAPGGAEPGGSLP